MPKRNPNRVTYSGLLDVQVECEGCGWEYAGKNGVGMGAQHFDRCGRGTVRCESASIVSFVSVEEHERRLAKRRADH